MHLRIRFGHSANPSPFFGPHGVCFVRPAIFGGDDRWPTSHGLYQANHVGPWENMSGASIWVVASDCFAFNKAFLGRWRFRWNETVGNWGSCAVGLADNASFRSQASKRSQSHISLSCFFISSRLGKHEGKWADQSSVESACYYMHWHCGVPHITRLGIPLRLI